ncbi:MAG: DUF2892 domain-containing protein [Haloarculaceae archaeon]
MQKNVGGMDRLGRVVVGIVALLVGVATLAGYLSFGTVAGVVALVVGAVLFVTGVIQKCPLNEIAGVDTTK